MPSFLICLSDGSDESSQDELKEDTYPSHRPLKVRRRRAAAKRIPNKDKLPDIKYTTSLDKTENSFVWDINPHKAAEPHTEEVSHILESEFTNNTRKEVIEEASGTKEPELIDVGCKEEEKVSTLYACPRETTKQFCKVENAFIKESALSTKWQPRILYLYSL